MRVVWPTDPTFVEPTKLQHSLWIFQFSFTPANAELSDLGIGWQTESAKPIPKSFERPCSETRVSACQNHRSRERSATRHSGTRSVPERFK